MECHADDDKLEKSVLVRMAQGPISAAGSLYKVEQGLLTDCCLPKEFYEVFQLLLQGWVTDKTLSAP